MRHRWKDRLNVVYLLSSIVFLCFLTAVYNSVLMMTHDGKVVIAERWIMLSQVSKRIVQRWTTRRRCISGYHIVNLPSAGSYQEHPWRMHYEVLNASVCARISHQVMLVLSASTAWIVHLILSHTISILRSFTSVKHAWWVWEKQQTIRLSTLSMKS